MSDTKPLFDGYHGDLESKVLTLCNISPLDIEDHHYALLDALIALTFRIQAIEDGKGYSHKN